MIYREAGQFKTSYAKDQALLSIPMDKRFVLGIILIAYALVPSISSEYWLGSIFIPVLILSIAAIGLNILTGYAGQLSLGTGAFMAAGGYMAYKVATNLSFLPVPIAILAGGFSAALAGIIFGIPSLRIKGFYLAVATLASQFFLIWLFTHVDWFVNYSISGVPSIADYKLFVDFGPLVTGANASVEARYLFVLSFAVLLALAARNMARGNIGRSWMAIRDMDIAAEIIGIRPLKTKLTAFAISSFYCGIAGALWAFCYINNVEPSAYDINRSFQILFMVIIGGLGSILGSFLGAAFIFLLPIFLSNFLPIIFDMMGDVFGYRPAIDIISHIEFMTFGALIIFFLIVEPHGLARLWQIGKEKLRRWPFPY